jgi:hypothetical protein
MIVSGYRAWASQRRLDKSAKAIGDKARMVSNTAQQVADVINPKESRYSKAFTFSNK